MKYVVTFCVLDSTTGSNPFWHSCLLLSKWDEKGGKMEVVDQWGFYGVPTTMPNSLLKKIKLNLGVDVDLYGNHGMLLHEQLRTLDLGYGLHGATFELTQEKFALLQQRCQTMATEQNQAIDEVMSNQGLLAKEKKDTRVYPYEHWSTHIYQFEKGKAQEQHRESRLKPFELNLSFTLWGPSFNSSYTCKSQAISLLVGILTEKQINRLTENNNHTAIPRYSGSLEDMFLHSTGPLRQHKKRSGKVVYYRALEDEKVKLYWTLPPQNMDALDEETNKQLQIPKDYCQSAKVMIRQLQRLEWLFRNATLPSQYRGYQASVIQQLCDCYDYFAQIKTTKPEPEIENTWSNYLYFLGSIPRNQDERSLLKAIQRAKLLCNSLYMAVVDNWEINLNYPMEQTGLTLSDSAEELDQDINNNDYTNAIEAIAAYIPLEDKKALCSILGRSYCGPESDSENNEHTQQAQALGIH